MRSMGSNTCSASSNQPGRMPPASRRFTGSGLSRGGPSQRTGSAEPSKRSSISSWTALLPTPTCTSTTMRHTNRPPSSGLQAATARGRRRSTVCCAEGSSWTLYRAVRQGIRASVESYSIKRLEPLYDFRREIGLRDAGTSIVEFETWLELGQGAQRDEVLAEIEGYNRDDCISTPAPAQLAGKATNRIGGPARRGPTPA